MTEIRADNLQDRAGSGKPDLDVTPTHSGGSALTTLNSYSYTSTSTKPSSPNDGALWWNSSDGDPYIYVNNDWYKITLNGSGTAYSASASGSGAFGDRGFRIGYYDTSNTISNNIEYWDISASSGNAVDFGDLTRSHYRGMAASSADYVYTIGGYTAFGSTAVNVIDRFATATTGNATDVGDTVVSNVFDGTAEASISAGRVVYCDGKYQNNNTTIEYFAFGSSVTAADFGDQNVAVYQMGSAANETRKLIAGGYTTSAATNAIQYITMATTGNAADFGDLTHGATYRNFGAGTGGQDKAIFGDGTSGGYSSANMQYVDITTTGNANDHGDLHTGSAINTGLCNATKAHVVGGYNGASINNIQQFTMATTANATDYGDLISAMSFPSASSGSPS